MVDGYSLNQRRVRLLFFARMTRAMMTISTMKPNTNTFWNTPVAS